MGIFKVIYTEDLYSAYVRKVMSYDPSNYLDYESEEEVREYIRDNIANYIDYADVEFKDCDSELNIPDEFFEEWERLKQMDE